MLPLLQRLLQYLPNAEMTLDLEANEVEVKVLTSLASVAEITESLYGRKRFGRPNRDNWGPGHRLGSLLG